jgi:hypothetical protein
MLLLVCFRVDSYIYVVPQESCMDMMPKHNSTPQLTQSPYSILTEKIYYNSFEKIRGKN